jgi:two-component system sensor histidine kinase/response regulator
MINISDINASILVVDDTPKNLQIIATILSAKRYNLAFAKDGRAGVNLAVKILPDLILMDVMMPQMNGLEACGELKELETTKDIPIIFITAKSEVNDIVHGFKNGGADYITKPFNKEELLVRIENQLEIVNSRKEIIRSREEIKSIMQTQDRLYSIIAHDLRSPLNSIQLILRSLEKRQLKPDSKEFTNVISAVGDSTQKTQVLLENLLIWTKNKTGNLKQHVALYGLESLLAETLLLFDLTFIQKDLVVEFNVDPSVKINVDKDMINTVFRNLISNAIKYTNRGGMISIFSAIENNHTILSIKDSGEGFDVSILELIFKEDIQYTTQGTEKEQGSGFGLILSKQLIEQNDASLKIESEPGKGSCFNVLFPIVNEVN